MFSDQRSSAPFFSRRVPSRSRAHNTRERLPFACCAHFLDNPTNTKLIMTNTKGASMENMLASRWHIGDRRRSYLLGSKNATWGENDCPSGLGANASKNMGVFAKRNHTFCATSQKRRKLCFQRGNFDSELRNLLKRRRMAKSQQSCLNEEKTLDSFVKNIEYSSAARRRIIQSAPPHFHLHKKSDEKKELLLLSNFEEESEKLLLQLRTTEFVGKVDHRYHSRYLSEASIEMR